MKYGPQTITKFMELRHISPNLNYLRWCKSNPEQELRSSATIVHHLHVVVTLGNHLYSKDNSEQRKKIESLGPISHCFGVACLPIFTVTCNFEKCTHASIDIMYTLSIQFHEVLRVFKLTQYVKGEIADSNTLQFLSRQCQIILVND